jgi:hypothetical protein
MKLTRLENAWASATLGAIFPGSRETGFASIARMDVRNFLGEVMGSIPFKAALGLRVAVWVIALAPLFVIHRAATIHGLEPAARERVVTALSASRSYVLRSLVMMLKTFGAMLYAGDDRVRERLGLHAVDVAAPVRAPRNFVPLRIKGVHVA